MKLNTRDIAVTSLFVGIVALMAFTPLGMIPLGFFSVNLVLVPIIICSQMTNWKSALIVSTAFGIFSLINSYVKPDGLLYFAVQNPLISVLPRMFIGLSTHFVYKALRKLFDRKKDIKPNEIEINSVENTVPKKKYGKTYFASLISTIVGVMTNTFGFFAMLLVVFGGTELTNGSVVGIPLLLGIMATNFVPELLIAILVCPAAVVTLENALKK
ncbi:MAG: ECF transporter S component [Clostridia bacterium]